MVKRVFTWRNEDPDDANALWSLLQSRNDDLAARLRALGRARDELLGELASAIHAVRSLVREMSTKAKVPIEPGVQTPLLDACSSLPGVVGGVVPGAGGYDALALLVENNEATVGGLASFLEQYQSPEGGPNEQKLGKVKLLGVQQERHGLLVEAMDVYHHWT